jgi:hypothetical protein
MPDNRTIYSTDDGSNGVLTMFKADKPGDLTSGVSASPLAETQGGQAEACCIQLQRATAALRGVRDTLWHSLHSAQLLQPLHCGATATGRRPSEAATCTMIVIKRSAYDIRGYSVKDRISRP